MAKKAQGTSVYMQSGNPATGKVITGISKANPVPRVLAGEHIGKAELAFLGHGGLCRDCSECLYPHCPFGKGF